MPKIELLKKHDETYDVVIDSRTVYSGLLEDFTLIETGKDTWDIIHFSSGTLMFTGTFDDGFKVLNVISDKMLELGYKN